jgi:hypothetical protein
MIRIGRARAIALRRLGLACLLGNCAAAAFADAPLPSANDIAPPSQEFGETAKGHGVMSISYLDTHVNGFKLDSQTEVPNGAVRSRGVALQIDYNYLDNWSVNVGIPFLSNRYTGNQPHCPTSAPAQCAAIPALSPQHPESPFLDDGKFHSTWQDWTVGTTYHGDIDGYLIDPTISYSFPSHDYAFFGNAAVAQDIWQLEISATLAHQLDFSNLYWRVGYGYVFTEHVLNTSVSHHKFDLELGYFFNEKLQARSFVSGRVGHGYTAAHLGPMTDGQTNDFWYRHDQISEHNYIGAGVGLDFALGNRFTLSSSVQREIWGETVFDFKYAFETRLSRAF